MDFKLGGMAKIEWSGEEASEIAVWKNPNVNFAKHSKLVVRETQKAVFYINGEIIDSKNAGEYYLDTGNISLVSSSMLDRILYGSYFSAEIYFVNLMEFRNIEWKTNNPIIFKDKTHGMYPYEIGLEGTYNFRISDPELILNKWVVPENYLTKARLVSFLTPNLIQTVTVELAKMLNELETDIFSLEYMIKDWAEGLTKELTTYSEDKYGVEFTELRIEKILYPTDDETFIERKRNMSIRANVGDRHQIELNEAKHIEELERIRSSKENGNMISGDLSFEESVKRLKFLKEQGLISEERLEKEITALMNRG